VILRSDRFRRL